MLIGIVTSLLLFAALLAALEFGRWLRLRRRQPATDGAADGGDDYSSAGDGVVFAILGLLIAFTFTASASRFDERRRLIVTQSNAIGTAWLRIDLLAEADREPIRRCMRDWVKLTLDELPKIGMDNDEALGKLLAEAERLQNEAWGLSVAAVQRDRPQFANVVLPPINEWIDLTTERREMSNLGLPSAVMPTLVVLALTGAVLAGYSMGKYKSRSPLHMMAFAGSIAFSLYVIADLNHPRAGLIRVDAADHAMKELYRSMQPATP